MLTIRASQITALEDSIFRRFKFEACKHVRELAPALTETVGEYVVAKAVDLALQRASSYGFTQRGPAIQFIELALFLGAKFEFDPIHDWSFGILSDRSMNQIKRAELLDLNLREYFAAVNGFNESYRLECLRRIHRLATTPVKTEPDDPKEQMLREAEMIDPHKTVWCGRAAIEKLADEAIKIAEHFEISGDNNPQVIFFLMFELGFHCIDDPLYPWICQTLRDTPVTERSIRLRRRAVTYLGGILQRT